MCTLTPTSHFTSLFLSSQDQEEACDGKADGVVELTCLQACS